MSKKVNRKLFIGDFGVREGVHTYRINGHYSDLEGLIRELYQQGYDIIEPPTIKQSFPKSLYTALVKLSSHDEQ